MLDGEKQIIEQAIGGEAEAFGLLYDHYQPQIYRFVYLKVSRREEAEDLTHQVFLKSWQGIAQYEFRELPFSSWLYRIARNEVIDYYRTKRGAVLSLDDPEETSDPGINDNTSDRIDQSDDFKKISLAIIKLKPSEQDVLILRFIEDLSHIEVSRILGKTPLAVRLLQHRAMRKLRHLLNSDGKQF